MMKIAPKYKDRELFTVHSKKRNENFQDTKAIFIEKATDFLSLIHI